MNRENPPGIDGRPQPAHSSKPDSSEPWRYVCPKCGKQVHHSSSIAHYRCDSCGESWLKTNLTDLKEQ